MSKIQRKIHEIIFEADTPMGKLFDISLLVMIILSVSAVMLESVEAYSVSYGIYFEIAEWFNTYLL